MKRKKTVKKSKDSKKAVKPTKAVLKTPTAKGYLFYRRSFPYSLTHSLAHSLTQVARTVQLLQIPHLWYLPLIVKHPLIM